jgi:hypothetical protein
MVIFGGQDGNAAYLGDLWSLSLVEGSEAWTQLTPSGGQGAQWEAQAVYDAANARMMMFGGFNGSTYTNKVWQLSLTLGSETWTERTPATSPSGRRGHVTVYDAVNEKMIMFGGYSASVFYDDTWALDLSNPGSETWTERHPTGGLPTERRSHVAVYDSADQAMVMYGGKGSGTIETFYNDVWKLSLPSSGDGVWTPLAPAVYLHASVPVTGLSSAQNYHWRAWVSGSLSGEGTPSSFGGNSDVVPAGVDLSIQ